MDRQFSTAIVVPTLGERPGLLQEALLSIQAQIPRPEILVVGPPTQSVRSTVEKFGARLILDPDKGLSSAINAAVATVSPGVEFVGWLGDDDMLTSNSLSRSTQALTDHPDASMVFGWCDYVDMEGRVVLRNRAGRLARWLLPFGPNLLPQPGSLFRLTDWRRVGGLNPDLELSMDLDLYLRLRKCGPVVAVPHTQAVYRWHADTLTAGNRRASGRQAHSVRRRHARGLNLVAATMLRVPVDTLLEIAHRRVSRTNRHGLALTR